MWHEWRRRELYADNLLGKPMCGINSSGSGKEHMARGYAQGNESLGSIKLRKCTDRSTSR
jgi:hypothetical protein